MLPYFFMAISVSSRPNIGVAITMSFLSHGLSLRFFFKKFLEIFKPLLIISKVSLKKTPNISLKKPKTRALYLQHL